MLRIWRRNGNVVRTIPHQAQIVDVAFSRDGRLVLTAGQDGVARVWRLSDGGRAAVVRPGGTAALSGLRRVRERVAHRRRGRHCADLASRRRAATRSPARRRRRRRRGVQPDGRFVATAGENGEARVWRAATAKLLGKLTGQPRGRAYVDFLQPGREAARHLEHRRGRSSLERRPASHTMRALRGHTSIVSDVTFSPDGRWIVTGRPDHGRAVGYGNGPADRQGHACRSSSAGTCRACAASHSLPTAADSRVRRRRHVRTYLCELCGTAGRAHAARQRRLDRLGSNLDRGGARATTIGGLAAAPAARARSPCSSAR